MDWLGVIGKVLRTSVEGACLKNGKVDVDTLEAIGFAPNPLLLQSGRPRR